jgi:cytochrome b
MNANRKTKGPQMDSWSAIASLSAPEQHSVLVWDRFVRVFHWLLAAAVLVDWFTDEPRWMHVWLGYVAAALVAIRLIWGFVGPAHARFSSFVTGPRAALHYLFGLIRLSSRRYIGHSPAGAAMVVALLVMVTASAVTGMANLAADEGTGALAGVIAKVERPARILGQRRPPLVMKQVHETVANITLVLIILHVCGVALASFVHKENLVSAMITGRKRA